MRTQHRSTTIALARLVALISIVGLGFMLSNWTALGTSGLSVTPTTVRFPPTALGSFSYQSVTITNNGTSTETLSSYTTPSAEFWATSGRCEGPPDYPISIPAGSSCDYEFGYAPSNPGAQSGAGTISFESGAVLNLMFEVGSVDGVSRIWGDGDCSGDIGPRDAQAVLKNVLVQNPLSQTQPCPAVGAQVTVDGVSRIWSDWDCGGDIGPRDAQAILKNVLVQDPLSQTQPCPAVGSTVQVVG
jgi:hypothetical protein